MEEPNESHSEVKQFTETKTYSNIPEEPINQKKSTNLIIMLLILVGTIGMIIYLTVFYIPNLKHIVYNQSETINNTNLTYYADGYNRGYVLGQEEIIIRINKDLEIPVVYNQSGELTVSWIDLKTICGV